MKQISKTLALVLAVALLAAGLAGCGSSSKGDYLLDSGGERIKVESVATIEGKPVTLGEFREYLLPLLDTYAQQMGPDIWEQYPEMFTALEDSALDSILWERVSEKYATEQGLAMTDKEKTLEIDSYIATLKEQMGGDVAYAGQLAQMGYTEEMFRSQLELQPYSIRLENEIAKEDGIFAPTAEELRADFEENYLRAKHILIANAEADGEPRDPEAVKTRATEALERAKGGESFDALIAEFGEDPGMTQSPDGYYFKEGDMVVEFYEGTKALADNAISGLVESSYGYHIIQRLPLEDSYFDMVKGEMLRTAAGGAVNEAVNLLIADSKIEKTPEFDLITPTNIQPEADTASSAG